MRRTPSGPPRPVSFASMTMPPPPGPRPPADDPFFAAPPTKPRGSSPVLGIAVVAAVAAVCVVVCFGWRIVQGVADALHLCLVAPSPTARADDIRTRPPQVLASPVLSVGECLSTIG